jgi:hypothetical protein
MKNHVRAKDLDLCLSVRHQMPDRCLRVNGDAFRELSRKQSSYEALE